MRGKKSNRALAKRLRFEQLERRQMLAELGLGVEVLAERSPMLVGDDFWLQFLAEDIRTGAEESVGIISLPIDVQWPDTSGDVIDFLFDSEFPAPPVFPDPIPLGHRAVTDSFTLQRYVDRYDPGSIAGLRGGAIPLAEEGEAIGAGSPEEFGRWKFDAVGAGRIELDVEPITAELAGSMAFADAALLTGERSFPAELEVQVLVTGRKVDEEGNPLSGWEIEVFRDDDDEGEEGHGLLDSDEFASGPLASAVTDAEGNYSFQLGVLEPDDDNPLGRDAHYVLVERLQFGWEQSAPDTPVWDGDVPPGYGPNGYARTVAVGSVGYENLDFRNEEIPVVGGISLSGFVYADGNNNGQRDLDENGAPLEPGLPNVTIHLDIRNGNGGWTEVDATTTAKDGWYHFDNLQPGTYQVREEQPECFLDGQESVGVVLEEAGDGRVRPGTVGDDVISDITLEAAQHGIDYNFGELGLRARCINKRMFLTDPPIQEILCDRLGLECVTVRGTSGDNRIVFEAVGDVLRVTVDSQPPQEFPVESVDILAIDAGAGRDTVVLTGEAGAIAHVQPGTGVIRSSDEYRPDDYSAEALNAEIIEVVSGGLAVLRDTPNNDSLVAEGDEATMNLPSADLIAIAMAYDSVHALSAYDGDDDTVERIDPLSFDLRLIGDWRSV